ncbi:fibrillarin-like rRNA methylase [Caldimicrobium thiodismutans]|uniref:Fibrillarin-like rRNA methylase n=1 Tax=Caldimicrobium thiodismutans TaxID=1653476 RepID=A0A0U5AVI1_9BACT|nr:class I SAM-dependent methyltransferase [Caldimicrobium thiodismutans]BAU22542.1 fibrillarin-like rRNA methylase [Caldimicrobium thiodismutans]
MAHKFDPRKLEKLESPERLKIFDPEALFKDLNLSHFESILDFGVGTGFYLPYLVSLLSPSGTIYAIDIQEELLRYAQEKYKDSPLMKKVKFLKIDEFEPLPFSPAFFDFIYLAFTFHELNEPHQTLKDLHHLLKKKGKLLLIDWDKRERDMGPPPEEVFEKEEIINLLKESSFKIKQKIAKEPYVWIFLAEKV